MPGCFISSAWLMRKLSERREKRNEENKENFAFFKTVYLVLPNNGMIALTETKICIGLGFFGTHESLPFRVR